MSFQLYVEGAGSQQVEELERLELEIDASLIQESTGLTPPVQVCKATGTPTSKVERTRWVVMSGGNVAALWHEACLDMSMSANHRYTLTVTTRPSSATLPTFNVVPTLEGGGIELP
jgi:hypothetical protein